MNCTVNAMCIDCNDYWKVLYSVCRLLDGIRWYYSVILLVLDDCVLLCGSIVDVVLILLTLFSVLLCCYCSFLIVHCVDALLCYLTMYMISVRLLLWWCIDRYLFVVMCHWLMLLFWFDALKPIHCWHWCPLLMYGNYCWYCVSTIVIIDALIIGITCCCVLLFVICWYCWLFDPFCYWWHCCCDVQSGSTTIVHCCYYYFVVVVLLLILVELLSPLTLRYDCYCPPFLFW